MIETDPVLPDPGAGQTGASHASIRTVAGVDRFAHFIVNRRDDGDLDRLGVGAMGVTYRAIDTQLERMVALKTIHPQWVDDPEVRSRFAREAKAAARLQHPNIASVLFQGEEASVCFYVMELVAGENLHHYIKRVGPLSPVHALRMAHQIALALVAASREGIIHRDLKPANIMLTSYHDGGEPHLKVIDFGLAKLAADSPATFSTSGFMGTPEFASPEQCQEQPLDARSDIYSLGGVLWFLLTAATPFAGTLLSVIRAQVSAQPAWEKLPGAPPPLLAILRRLMAKNREFRPSSPLDAAREIEQAIEVLSHNRKNFHPLGSALDTGDASPDYPSGGLPTVAATLPLNQTHPEQASNRWIIPAAISICCFAGGIYAWSASRNHQAEVQNTPGANTTSPAPPIAAVITAGSQTPPPKTASPETPDLRRPTIPAPESTPSPKVAATVNPPHVASPAATAPAYTNSLGMRFARPTGSAILVSIWETRLRDFEAYASQSSTLMSIASDPKERSWRNPGFPQTNDHPVVCVSPPDALAFCKWLTDREHKAGSLPSSEFYRLPTRLEWDQLLTGQRVNSAPPPQSPPPPPPNDWQPGMPLPRNAGPGEPYAPQQPGSGGFVPGATFAPSAGQPPFFWGTSSWPPPLRFANYGASAYSAGNSAATAGDGFAFTAPVGSFEPNVYGLYDMSGNAAEICTDGPPNSTAYIKQGGSWASVTQSELRMRQAIPAGATQRESTTGFRCVIVAQ